MVRIGARNSFITNSFVKIKDVGIGLNFNKTTKVGISFNWLKTDVFRPLTIEGVEVKDGIGELKMRYIAPFFEYTFIKRKRYSFSIPVQLGVGRAFFKFKDNAGNKLKTDRVGVAFYEPAMVGEYIFLKYLAVGAGIGYRFMFIGNRKLEDKFTAPVYILKFKILFGELYKDIMK